LIHYYNTFCLQSVILTGRQLAEAAVLKPDAGKPACQVWEGAATAHFIMAYYD